MRRRQARLQVRQQSHRHQSRPARAGSSTGGTTTKPNKSLAKNSIYAVDLGDTQVSCKVKVRSPKPPLKDSNLASYGKRLVGCLVKAFAEPLAAYGINLTTPKIKAYRNTIKTPCGRFGQNGCPGLLLLDYPDDLLAGDR